MLRQEVELQRLKPKEAKPTNPNDPDSNYGAILEMENLSDLIENGHWAFNYTKKVGVQLQQSSISFLLFDLISNQKIPK